MGTTPDRHKKVEGPLPTNFHLFKSVHARGGYFRTAHAYMLISSPTGTSTIFGVFQAIMRSPRGFNEGAARLPYL
jgi:hypothetical protein